MVSVFLLHIPNAFYIYKIWDEVEAWRVAQVVKGWDEVMNLSVYTPNTYQNK